jgi:hypothetical protein
MEMNILAIFVAALSALAIGFVWCNPKVFGNAWIRESGVILEGAKKQNMIFVMVLSLIYAFLIAFSLQPIVIHQWGVIQAAGGDPTVAAPSLAAFMADYGTSHRHFGHGVLHGLFAGLFLILPIFATTALYERKSWKYVMITAGYWIVCFMVMGGIICAWV